VYLLAFLAPTLASAIDMDSVKLPSKMNYNTYAEQRVRHLSQLLLAFGVLVLALSRSKSSRSARQLNTLKGQNQQNTYVDFNASQHRVTVS
jgi:hypothetical protein